MDNLNIEKLFLFCFCFVSACHPNRLQHCWFNDSKMMTKPLCKFLGRHNWFTEPLFYLLTPLGMLDCLALTTFSCWLIERSYCRQIEEQNPGGQVHNIFHLNVVISLFGQTSQQQSCQVIWSNIQVIRHMFITLVHWNIQVQGLRNYSGSREVMKLCPEMGRLVLHLAASFWC